MRSFLSLLVFVAFLSFAGSAQAATLAKPANNLGLIGYWPLDEGAGATAADFSGNGNTGTITGATWTTGKLGEALHFDGTADYVDMATNVPADNFTLSLWFKLDQDATSRGAWQYIFSSGGFNLYQHSANNDIYLYRLGARLLGIRPTIGQWHHLACAIDHAGSGANGPDNWTGNCYVDGVQVSLLQNGSIATSTGLRLGATGTPLIGSIDDVRIYKRLLSAAEIQDLYKTGAGRVNNPDRNGLIGEWKFDEGGGTAAIDSSNQKNNGTVVNGAWVNGKHGSALSLNGSNSYVLVGSPSGPSGAATIAAWIYKNANTAWTSILDRFASESLDCLALGFDNSTGKKLMFLWNATSADSWANKVIGTSDIPTGQWVHVAASSNGSTVTFYVNGVPDGTASSGAPCTTGNMYIGVNYAGSDEYFNGKIDDLRLYDRALSAAEIQGLYQDGAVRVNVDTTANTPLASGLVGYWSFNGPDVTDKIYDRIGGNNGYFVGGATSSAKTIGKLGQALQFNGSSVYASISSLSALNNSSAMTICAWVYLNTVGTTNDIDDGGIITKSTVSSNEDLLLFYNVNTGGTDGLHVYTFNVGNSGTASNRVNGATAAKEKVWQQVCGVMSGSNRYLYLDGALDATAAGAALATYTGGTAETRIGSWSNTSNFNFDGKIDEVRVYNRALTAAEIQQLYLAGK